MNYLNKQLMMGLLISAGTLTAGLNKAEALEVGEEYTPQLFDEGPCEIRGDLTIDEMPGHALHLAMCDGRAEAWISKILVPSTKEQRSKRVVIDKLMLGTLKGKEKFVVPVCLYGKSNTSLTWVGVYRWKAGKKNTYANGGIVQGWVINPKTMRLELAEPEFLKKVVCMEEEYD